MNSNLEYFGSMVFGDEDMKARLPQEIYSALRSARMGQYSFRPHFGHSPHLWPFLRSGISSKPFSTLRNGRPRFGCTSSAFTVSLRRRTT